MNDFIDIQERPSLGKLLPLSFNIYLLCLALPYLYRIC